MSSATQWSSYNTPRIWAMVANEDNPESWHQVAALGSMAGLLQDQRSRLEAAKQKLTDAWPPEKNKAAAAFVLTIDDLLLNMDQNKKIADTNAGALGRVLEALRQAKAEIGPLYESYLKKSDDWVPGWWDNAEDELDEKAREQMRAAERIVAHPDNAIQPPDLYEFKPRDYVTKRLGGSGDGGLDDGEVASSPGLGGSEASVAVPHDPPPAVPIADAGQTSGAGEVPAAPAGQKTGPAGPQLSGVITPSPVVPAAAAPVTPPILPGSGSGPAVPGLIIGGPSGFGGSTPRGGGSRGLPGSETGGGGPLGRAGNAAVKPAAPSWMSPSAGQAADRGSGRTARGSAHSNLPPMPQTTGARGRNSDREQAMTFDPDNPWATEQGVDPVIEPSRVEHRHDPGPGVIGWPE